MSQKRPSKGEGEDTKKPHNRSCASSSPPPPVPAGHRRRSLWIGISIVILLTIVVLAVRLLHDPASQQEARKAPNARRTVGPLFTDVTQESGITFLHTTGQKIGRMLYPEIMGAGIILFDYDNDSDLDIYFLNGNYIRGRRPDPKMTNVLYRNDGLDSRGKWRFTDVTETAGVADSGYAQGGEAADFDNDGDQDLYVSNLGPNVYFRNEGNATFTRTSLMADEKWGQCCAALDYDNDGDLDLYLVNYLNYDPDNQPLGIEFVAGNVIHEYQGPLAYDGSPDILYRNNGDGTFSDITREVGLHLPGGKGMGLGVADFDNDGDADVFVACDFSVNCLFENQSGKFVERAVQKGVAVSGDGNLESSMGVDVADVDNDGFLDIMVPCRHREIHTLYYNEGPLFSDASSQRGMDKATLGFTGFSPSFLDFDNDGDMDLLMSTGRVVTLEEAVRTQRTRPEHFEERYAQTDLFLENNGRGYFQRVPPETAGPHFLKKTISRGTAVGDLDNDGDLDAIINVSEGSPVVLRNNTNGGHWLTLKLVGTASNRDAIGCRVAAWVGDKVQYHYLKGGGSYLSVSDRRIHLGLGSATRVDRIEITWPSGRTQRIDKVREVDRFMTISEPGNP